MVGVGLGEALQARSQGGSRGSGPPPPSPGHNQSSLGRANPPFFVFFFLSFAAFLAFQIIFSGKGPPPAAGSTRTFGARGLTWMGWGGQWRLSGGSGLMEGVGDSLITGLTDHPHMKDLHV